MQTQTHVLLALALFSKRGRPSRNWAILGGALATDLFIYFGFIWFVLFQGQTAQTYFDTTYFKPDMQLLGAISNSLPLYACLAILAVIRKPRSGYELLLYFALAGLTQTLLDLPVHADDAHRHFWPLTDWRFHSPISYWDPAHYGRYISLLDNALGLGCIYVLWRRFKPLWGKILLGLTAIFYLLVTGFILFVSL